MSKCSQVFAIAGTFVLCLTFQNCDKSSSGVADAGADTSSTTQVTPNPTQGPMPSPSPGTIPNPSVGANPMPLGLKAAFRPGNILMVGINQFPLDLNQPASQKIEVDISSHDTAYLINSLNAIPNDDYVPFAGQTIAFNPGVVTQAVNVQLLKFTGKFFLFSAANCRYGGVPFSCVYLF